MAIRTPDLSVPVCVKRVRRGSSKKQSILLGRQRCPRSQVAVWAIILLLLVQQSAIARVSLRTATSDNHSDAVLSEAGSVFVDSTSGSRIVRVTDSRDGQASISARVNASSFNLDSSRFIVNVDGTPVLYSMTPASLVTRKQGPLFGLSGVQPESLRWSAVDASTIIGLENAGSSRLIAYDTNSGKKTILKDFSTSLGNGEAAQLSKSWFDDNHFAFSWRENEAKPSLVVVWDRAADSTFVFYLNDPVCGVSSFTEAHLDRSGNALIVNGDTTRVWRYRTSAQSESVQLENNDRAGRNPMIESRHSESFDLFASIGHRAELPHMNVSPDGRFSIFSSRTDRSHSDVFIAAVNVNVAASSITSSITWTNMVNCSTVANSLQKTGGVDMNDDAHATSAQAALSGDAYVEFTAQQADKERLCGLNNSNEIHQSADDINFAIRLANNKKAIVVENGVIKAKTKYKPGNVFRIAVESGVVNYYKNGSAFYTSTASPAYPLLVDASLLNTMAAVDNVMISAAQVGSVISISPAKVSLVVGATTQFTALVTGGPGDKETITWSATGGTITSSGFYTAPWSVGTYTVRAASTSNANISASATVVVTLGVDVAPPVISSVTASNITASGVTITWNTDEPSDTQVEYGIDTSHGNFSTRNAALVTSHGVSLGGLTPATVYHYRVRSKDAAGNQAISGDFSFTTQGGGDTTPPVISGVSVSSITTNSVTITWTTNEAGDTQVNYGTTTGYGSSTGLNTTMVTIHSAFVSGLSAGAQYHYRVKSKDSPGNLGVSGDFTFTTSAPPPPDPGGGVITDHNVYPEPSPPALPAAGGTFVDPTFGTTIMRVTDERDGQSNYNYYSYWPSFNLDVTRFFINCSGSPMLYRFDASGFRIISKGPLFDQTLPGGGFMSTEDAEWSGTNPNVLYGYYGLKLWAFDVSARTYTLVKDFSGLVPSGYLGQMSRSLDDNMFAFTLKDTNYNATGYMVWQRDQNRIVRTAVVPNYDEVELDKTGRYLVVKAEIGGGVDFQVVDLETGNVQGLTDSLPDYSPGHSDNGHQMVVGHDNWNNQYTARSLATPHQFQRVISFGNDWSQSNHLSMLGDNESWCLISNFTSGSGPVGPFRQEIFQASTDGTQSVRRLAHHHSVYRDYWDTPRANMSRDGRFVVFTSNWGSATRRDVFIIRVP